MTVTAAAQPCEQAALPVANLDKPGFLSLLDSTGTMVRVLAPDGRILMDWMPGPAFREEQKRLAASRNIWDYVLEGRTRLCNPSNLGQAWQLTVNLPATAQVTWPWHLNDSNRTTIYRPSATHTHLPAFVNIMRVVATVELPAHQGGEMHWHISGIHDPLSQVRLRLEPFTPTQLHHHLLTHLEAGWLLGGAVAMLLFNILLLAIVRDRVYAYYLLVLVCVVGHILVNISPAFTTIYPAQPEVQFVLGELAFLPLPVFYVLFARKYLDLRHMGLGWASTVFTWLQWTLLTTALLALGISFELFDAVGFAWSTSQLFVRTHVLLSAVAFLFGVVAAALAIRRGQRAAWVFFLANVPLPLAWLAVLLISLDKKTSVLLQQSILGMSMVFEMILFSAALLVRFVSQRKELAQAKAEQEQMLAERNEVLEREVVERTESLEEAMVALQALNAEKDELMGIAAHDLKNPVAAIQMFARSLRASDAAVPADVQQAAKSIEESADWMLTIITNLLEINRLEQGLLEIELQPVDVDQLTQQVVMQYQHQAHRKQINLQLLVAPNRPTIAQSNPLRLHQVLDNLLSNALKFSPTGRNVTVRISTSGDEVQITVADEGPGLTEADRQKLFQKFARLSAQPTGGESSTGLGLSIVQQLVELMEGHITVQSTPGQGTAFTVHLPLADSYSLVSVPQA